MRLKVYFGKVCAKHPELKGERYLSNRTCVECQLASSHKYDEENREADLARMRKYHEENRESRLARKRKWKDENKGYVLAYYREHAAAFKAKHGICRSTYYDRLKKERELQCAPI